MRHDIVEATAHPDYTVSVRWSDGVRTNVDFAPYVARGAVFAALADRTFFVREMRILRGGLGLGWPDEIDFSADGLRQNAFPEDAADADEDGPAPASHLPSPHPA